MPPRLPSAGQFAVQQLPMYAVLPIGQEQVPPQPSDLPALLPSLGQLGVQTQVPSTHRPLVPQPFPPQSQVLMQRPLLQTLPAAQVTPEQRFSTHWPLTQT